jgi:hypothetical protein
MSLGIEFTPVVKSIVGAGAGAAALAAIWKIIRLLQGPAADNKVKLEKLGEQMAHLESRTAVIENTLVHIQASAEIAREERREIREEFLTVRGELGAIRDAILRLGKDR